MFTFQSGADEKLKVLAFKQEIKFKLPRKLFYLIIKEKNEMTFAIFFDGWKVVLILEYIFLLNQSITLGYSSG